MSLQPIFYASMQMAIAAKLWLRSIGLMETPERDSACPVAIRGMYDNLADIHGEDSLQALCLAASLVRTLIAGFVSDGGKLSFPDSDRDDDSRRGLWPGRESAAKFQRSISFW
jgi:hypothetical protein